MAEKKAIFAKGPPLPYVAAGILAAVFFLLFVHTDIIETANHSYLLLRCLFSGRPLAFYEEVMAHPLPLYYINNAHYNIAIYLLFAMAELPIYIVTNLLGLAVSEAALYYTGKLVCLGFFVGCGVLAQACARQLGLGAKTARLAGLFVWLWPPAFFSAVVMGQYDSICLFFILLAFWYWLRGNLRRFTLFMALAILFKFFALFLFVPLLLLAQKRVLRLVQHALCGLAPLALTTLLYGGRGGDMGLFNSLMGQRLFAAVLPGGFDIPLFGAGMLALCFAAYLWRPQNPHKAGLWLCLAALCLLFLFVPWHPQWLILLAPFFVLSTLMEQNRLPWLLLDIAFGIAFFVRCAYAHPYQLEANLFDFGAIGLATAWNTSMAGGYNSASFYLDLLPFLPQLAAVVLSGGLLLQLVLKCPTSKGTLAARLAGDVTMPAKEQLAKWPYVCFAVPMACWLFATLFTYLKCRGLL